MKDATGRVDHSCIPASLEPGQFAQWLRAETLAQLRQIVSPPEEPRRELRHPRKYRPVTLDLIGEYTHMAGQGPEEARIASETLADLLALASNRVPEIIRLRLDNAENVEIAEELGCSERTVRRDLDGLYQRARAAGILGAGAGRALGVAPREKVAADGPLLTKAA